MTVRKEFSQVSKAWYHESALVDDLVEIVDVLIIDENERLVTDVSVKWLRTEGKLISKIELTSEAWLPFIEYGQAIISLLEGPTQNVTATEFCAHLLASGYEENTPYPTEDTHATHIDTSIGCLRIPEYAAKEMATLSIRALADKAFGSRFVSQFHFAELIARGIAKKGMSKQEIYRSILKAEHRATQPGPVYAS